jgi:chromosome segregation ATPase
LEQIQEEIRQKVTDYVRLEQLSHKQQTEIKTLRERTKSYEEEINDLKKFVDKLKKDLLTTKDESINLQQENNTFKNSLNKIQHELDARKDQEKMMNDQIAQIDYLLQQSQSDIRNERSKQQECQRIISQLKQSNLELNHEKEANEKQIKDLHNKVII